MSTPDHAADGDVSTAGVVRSLLRAAGLHPSATEFERFVVDYPRVRDAADSLYRSEFDAAVAAAAFDPCSAWNELPA